MQQRYSVMSTKLLSFRTKSHDFINVIMITRTVDYNILKNVVALCYRKKKKTVL